MGTLTGEDLNENVVEKSFHKNPLVHRINQALVELKDEGVLQTLFHKWWYKNDCLSVTDDPRIFDLSFTEKVYMYLFC